MSRANMHLLMGLLLLCALVLPMFAQQQTAVLSNSAAAVPPLVSYGGVLKDASGKVLTSLAGVTFLIYKDEEGGAPLWLETQNVYPDKTGHYTVQLGSTSAHGLPFDMFQTGEARWLAVQVAGEAEQVRVQLVAVPYAMKAGDAQTIGGLPPSAFVLAAPPATATASAGTSSAATTVQSNSVGQATCNLTSDNTGVTNALAKFSSPCNVEGSGITEDSSGRVGIGAAPLTTSRLTVSDTQTNFGTRWLQKNVFNTSATTNGKNQSLAFDLDATNMTIPAGVTDSGYRLAVRGVAYADTTGFAGTLSQQLGMVGEAGILHATNGASVGTAIGGEFEVLNRVAGTTITNGYGVYIYNADTAGTITNRYDLFASSANAKNYFAGSVGVGTTNPAAKLEVNGTALFDGLVTFAPGQTFPGTGTGSVTSVGTGLGLKGGPITGAGTLTIDSTVIPFLAGNNVFTGNQTVNGSLSATGVVTGSSYQIGSSLFAWGSTANYNAFDGYAGRTAMTGIQNTGSGYQALSSNQTGNSNTAMGYFALASNTSGYGNTAIGAATLWTNQAGGYNTAVGLGALQVNSAGSYNTANGGLALQLNTTGSNNTANGYQALEYNTVAGGNVAVGSQALYSNAGDSNYDGWYNTAVGTGALFSNNDTSGSGSYALANTAVGYNAMYSNTKGAWNTAVGHKALNSNTTGSYNTALGYQALSGGNANLFYNTAVGYLAAKASSNFSNSAFGYNALTAATTGGWNTAIGTDALQTNVTGSYNTAIGVAALSATTGSRNIGIGTWGGDYLTTGSYNIDIGNEGVSAESNTIRIGVQGTQTATYVAGIYNGNMGGNVVYVNSSGQLSSYSSSRRFKQDILDLGDTTNIVMRLRPVRFHYKSQGQQGPEQYGLIAEEVNEVVPEMVGHGQDGQIDSVRYDKLDILLLNELQKQHRLLEAQKKQLQAKISRLQQQVHAQQAQINEQRAALKVQAKQSQLQQAAITRLGSQIMAIQVTLKNLAPSDSELRTAKAEAIH